MHLIVWAAMGHEDRPRDDQAVLFILIWIFFWKLIFDFFFFYWKDEWRLRGVSRDGARVRPLIESLVWTRPPGSQTLTWCEYVVSFLWPPSIMHALYWSTSKVLSRGEWSKNCTASVVGNRDVGETLCWWFLFEGDEEQMSPGWFVT